MADVSSTKSPELAKLDRFMTAVRVIVAVLVSLVGLGLTWRSEGDIVTLAGVLLAVSGLLILPRPASWRGFLSGAALVVAAIAALALVAAVLIVVGDLMGFEGTAVESETIEVTP